MPARVSESSIAALTAAAAGASVAERLVRARAAAPGRIVFTTSFGLEDQVLTHFIVESGLKADIVTLDTGRLFPETQAVWAQTERRYGVRIRAYVPQAPAVEDLVARDGIDGFYRSVAARKACCHVRKVEPLRRALAGAAIWVTGLRSDQSSARGGVALASWDEPHGVLKLNPLFDHTRPDLVTMAAAADVPLNALHGRGFPSIGCAPCTRAVRPGEPERAGRWWWETDGQQECGLHVAPDGRIVRARQTEATP